MQNQTQKSGYENEGYDAKLIPNPHQMNMIWNPYNSFFYLKREVIYWEKEN